MTRMMYGLLAIAAVVLLSSTIPSASAQALPGIGINGNGAGGGGGLGPPPAGVLLHKQYMQLYGLPTNFQQQQQFNNNQAGGGGYGGYGGGYGGGPRYFGVNYQRQLAAMRAAQAYNGAAAGYYGNNTPPQTAHGAPSTGGTTAPAGFGLGSSHFPSFLTTDSPTMTGANGFGGFGLNADPARKEKKPSD